MTKINVLDKNIHCLGRIDKSSGKPIFTWPGCMMKLNFIGTAVKMTVNQIWGWGERKIGVVIDGNETSFDLSDGEN